MSAVVDPLFFSTFPYAACKTVGNAEWPAALRHELANLDESPWAGFRTLGQARRVAHCEVYVDASTYITRARCVAAGHFLRKSGRGADVWLTCDDDMFAAAGVLENLVGACRATKGLVALPYLNRDGKSMTFRKVSGPTVWQATRADHSVPLRTVDRVGMGLCAMHRDFVSALDSKAEHFEDDYPALFCEGVRDGVWVGEDYWLCALAEAAGLPMHVLLNAPASHENLRAMLDVEGRILVSDSATASTLERGIAEKAVEQEAKTATHKKVSADAKLVRCNVCQCVYKTPAPETCCLGGEFLTAG